MGWVSAEPSDPQVSHWLCWGLAFSSADSEAPSPEYPRVEKESDERLPVNPIHSNCIVCQVLLWAKMLLV